MARLLTTNLAATVLGSSLGGTSGDTTIALGAGTGALFPALPYTGDYFHGVLINSSGQSEIVKVTARSTDSLTVVRGQEGTTIRAFASGDRFELRLTAADVEFLQSSYWSRESAVVARVDGDEFTVVGDLTTRYVQYRSVFAIQTSSAQGFVVSSSYSAGTGLTTVVVEGLTVDSGLVAMEYGQDPTSAPKYGANSGAVKVSADDTTAGYLDGKLALASNSCLTTATTSPGGNEVFTIGLDLATASGLIASSAGLLVDYTAVQAYDADTLKADTSDVLTAGFLQAATTITDGATPTIDLTASNHFLWVLGAARTFPDVTPSAAGRWLFQISGNYVLSFDGAYTVYGDAYDGSGTNSNLVLFVFDGTNKKMYVKSIAVAA